jgi:hypothetical protein
VDFSGLKWRLIFAIGTNLFTFSWCSTSCLDARTVGSPIPCLGLEINRSSPLLLGEQTIGLGWNHGDVYVQGRGAGEKEKSILRMKFQGNDERFKRLVVTPPIFSCALGLASFMIFYIERRWRLKDCGVIRYLTGYDSKKRNCNCRRDVQKLSRPNYDRGAALTPPGRSIPAPGNTLTPSFQGPKHCGYFRFLSIPCRTGEKAIRANTFGAKGWGTIFLRQNGCVNLPMKVGVPHFSEVFHLSFHPNELFYEATKC